MTISLYTDLGLSLFRCMGEGDRVPTSRDAMDEVILVAEEANLVNRCQSTRSNPASVINLPDLLTRFIGTIISG